MKKHLPILILLFFFPLVLFSQTLSGRLSSSVYTFERFESKDVSNTFLRSYQHGLINLSKSKFLLRTSFVVEQDLIKKVKYDPRVRFTNFYLEGRELFNLLTLRIGRQPLYHSVASGIFDGLTTEFKYQNLKVSAYYGGNVPAYQKLGLIDKWNENYLAGGKINFSWRGLFFSAGYINKNFKEEDYVAIRLDDDFNADTLLIKRGSSQYEFLNAELGYDFSKISLSSNIFYDLNYNKISKLELFGNIALIKNFDIDLYYNYREPLIRYNSYFSIFESVVENTQEIEAGLNYRINSSFNVVGKFGFVDYSFENSSRLTAGLITPYGVINYRKSFGYAGELDGISIFSNYSILNGLLTPSVSVGYSSYKLSKDSPKNSVLYLLIGSNFRPWRVLSFDLQGQYLNNKIYKSDFRLFFKINYWFNTKLNVL